MRDVALRNLAFDVRADSVPQQQLVHHLQVRPGGLQGGLVLFGVKVVARRRQGPKNVGLLQTARHGKGRKSKHELPRSSLTGRGAPLLESVTRGGLVTYDHVHERLHQRLVGQVGLLLRNAVDKVHQLEKRHSLDLLALEIALRVVKIENDGANV